MHSIYINVQLDLVTVLSSVLYADPPWAHPLILQNPSNLVAPDLWSETILKLSLKPPLGATGESPRFIIALRLGLFYHDRRV